MSNSDNTSNSDDKLDALYKLTQRADSDLSPDVSPPDIDASLVAAAREATTGHAATQTDAPSDAAATNSNGVGWQQRYGWATAATLLLTSVLFVSQLNTEPQSAVIGDTDGFAADEFVVDEFVADEFVADEAEVQIQVEPSHRVPATSPVGTMTQSAPAPQAAQASQATQAQEERVVVTSKLRAQQPTQARRKSVQSYCEDYPELLISQVCTNPLADSASFTLRANDQSECAGQTLRLHGVNKQPQPDDSSTLARFVIQSEQTDNALELESAFTEQIVCQSGKLIRQSLARGR